MHQTLLGSVGAANPNTKLGIPRLNEQLPINSEEFQEQFRNNYLIVKPQYTLSYNDNKRSSNWVSFQLNCNWTEQHGEDVVRRDEFRFNIDTDVPWNSIQDGYRAPFKNGHLAGSDERRRRTKASRKGSLL